MSDDPIHPMLDDAIRREQIAEAQSRIKALEESLCQARIDALEEAAKVADAENNAATEKALTAAENENTTAFTADGDSSDFHMGRSDAACRIAAAIRKLKETGRDS